MLASRLVVMWSDMGTGSKHFIEMEGSLHFQLFFVRCTHQQSLACSLHALRTRAVCSGLALRDSEMRCYTETSIRLLIWLTPGIC